MNNLKLQVPVGTFDCLPENYTKKRKILNIIEKEFYLNGYQPVDTPSFEYYDVFLHDSIPYTQENIIKFFDTNGRILALRPDMTGPIARMTATRLNPAQSILRLSYAGLVYGYKRGLQRTQSTQAGVELIGSSGIDGDVEVISLAATSMLKIGLDNFTIDLGQVEFFKGLIFEAGLDNNQTERIRLLIDSKNSVELEYELSKMKIKKSLKESFLKLINLYGDEKIFDEALSITNNEHSLKAIENIKTVYKILCDYGYKSFISIDLGLLNNFNYYSGIIFRGLTNGVGHPILSGGRYDNLLNEFGINAPAIGFAVCIEDLYTALANKNFDESDENNLITVLKCKPENCADAYKYANLLRANGQRVIIDTKNYEYNIDSYKIIEFD